ncbi:DUF883 family protein [Pararobbsia alpina]|uniref:DUF883 family protein n=1 Tax=Pararobbsia alpina TaxID=621374 RepID=UPI0039A4D896
MTDRMTEWHLRDPLSPASPAAPTSPRIDADTKRSPTGLKAVRTASSAPDMRSDTMTDQSIQLQLGRQKIAEDLRTLIADTEELLRLTASASGEQIDVLRSRLRERLDEAKTALAEASSVARGKYRVAADNADQYVRDNPWQAVGVGVGVGILLGVLAAR